MMRFFFFPILVIFLFSCKDPCDDGPYKQTIYHEMTTASKDIIADIVPVVEGDTVRYKNSMGGQIVFVVTYDFIGFPENWDSYERIECDGWIKIKYERREIELIDTTNTHKLTYRFDEVDVFEINYYKKPDSLSYEWIFGMDYRLTNDCHQLNIGDSVYYDTFGNDDQCRFVFKSGLGILNIFDYEIDLSSMKKK